LEKKEIRDLETDEGTDGPEESDPEIRSCRWRACFVPIYRSWRRRRFDLKQMKEQTDQESDPEYL
jgi:hypothetical protein